MAQEGIGTNNPDPSSALDVTSTTQGMLIPRLTTAQRVAIASPAEGLRVYDTDTKDFWYFDGTVWVQESANAGEWEDGQFNGADGIVAKQANAAGTPIVITDSGNMYVGMESPEVSVDAFRDTRLGVYKEVNQAANAFGNDLHYGLSTDMRPNYSADTDQRIVGLQSGIKTDASSSANYTNGGAFRATNSAFTHFGSGQINGANAINLISSAEGTGGITNAKGAFISVQSLDANTIDNAIGVQSRVYARDGGTITNGYALEATSIASAGGTIENYRGLYVNPNSSSNITNSAYGVYINSGFNNLPATDKYAIYSNTTVPSYILGEARFGRDIVLGSNNTDFASDTWNRHLAVDGVGLFGTQGAYATSITNNLTRLQSDASQYALMGVGPVGSEFDNGQLLGLRPNTGLRYSTVRGQDPTGATTFGSGDIELQFEIGLDGTTKIKNDLLIGSVAVGATPDNPLHIMAATDPVKLEGLQDDVNPANKVVVADADGVLKTIDQSALGSELNDNPWDNPDGTVATQASTDINFMNGNVGIGTTTPDDIIHIEDSSGEIGIYKNDSNGNHVANDQYGAIKLGFEAGSIQQGVVKISAISETDVNTGGGVNNNVSGALAFSTLSTTNNLADNTASPIERMRIASNGNVGIGNDSPDAKLDIVGNGGVVTRLTAGGTDNWAEIDLISSRSVANEKFWNIGNNGGTGNLMFRSLNDDRTAPSTVMSMSRAGNVGIGTNNQEDKLEVNGSMSVGQDLQVGRMANGSNLHPSGIGGNWVSVFAQNYNGNLGANFPNPDAGVLLTNHGSSGLMPWGMYMGLVKDQATTNASSLRMDFGTTSNLSAENAGDDTVTPLMTMRYNGNVGIGLTTPSQALEVKGNNITVSNDDNLGSGLILQTKNAGFGLADPDSKGWQWQTFGDQSAATGNRNDMTLKYVEAGSATNVMWFEHDTKNIGVNVNQPTNPLHINATDPLRLEGLQDDANPANKVVVADADGVLKTMDASALAAGEWEDDGAGGIRAKQANTNGSTVIFTDEGQFRNGTSSGITTGSNGTALQGYHALFNSWDYTAPNADWSDGVKAGWLQEMTVNNTSNVGLSTGGRIAGLRSAIETSDSSNSQYFQVVGGDFASNHMGTQRVRHVIGTLAYGGVSGSGNADNIIGLEAQFSNNGPATANNAIGVNILPFGSGTINNAYGLRVRNVTQGTNNNYAIYTDQGAVRLGELSSAGALAGTDNIVVADTNGVLKTVAQSSIAGSSPFKEQGSGDTADENTTGNIYYTGGNLAIGVNSASAPLSVRGSGSTQATIVGTGLEADLRIQSFNATGNATVNYKNGTNQFKVGLINDRFSIQNVGNTTDLTLDQDGDIGIGIGNSSADNRLHVSAAADPVKFEGLQDDANATNKIVTADADGVLKTNSAANLVTRSKIFYPPAVPVNIAATGTGFTLDLHQEYVNLYGTPAVTSPGAAALPTFSETELDYYVLSFDNTVFSNVLVDANGVLTYDVVSVPPSSTAYFNVVFQVK